MSAFLSSSEIIDLVKSGLLKIAYKAIYTPDGQIIEITEKRFLSLNEKDDRDELDKNIRNYFYKNLEPDSYRCNLGPYALIERQKRFGGLKYVEHHHNDLVINIRDAGHLKMYPSQFFVVGTNEYFEFSPSIGGTIFPNARNTDVGIAPITGLVDPSWHGIFQFGFNNVTEYTKQLEYLDPVCIVRFHTHTERSTKEILDNFKEKRPHYGNDWWKINSEKGRTIFPRRKEYDEGGQFSKFIDKEKQLELIKRLFGGIGIATALAFLAWIIKIGIDVQDARENKIVLNQLKSSVDELSKLKHNFQFIETKKKVIKIRNGNTTLPVVFDFKRSEVAPAVFVSFSKPGMGYFVEYEIIKLSGKNLFNGVTVSFFKQANFINKDLELDVSILVVHRQ